MVLSDLGAPSGFHVRLAKVIGSNARNSHNITLTNNNSLTEDEEATWSLPGTVAGFISWLLALATPVLIYDSNTLFFSVYTWPFPLALMPAAVVVGITLYLLMDGKLHYSIVFTLVTVGIMFGILFMWLLG